LTTITGWGRLIDRLEEQSRCLPDPAEHQSRKGGRRPWYHRRQGLRRHGRATGSL